MTLLLPHARSRVMTKPQRPRLVMHSALLPVRAVRRVQVVPHHWLVVSAAPRAQAVPLLLPVAVVVLRAGMRVLLQLPAVLPLPGMAVPLP